jgi:iron(III) transport system permease protein
MGMFGLDVQYALFLLMLMLVASFVLMPVSIIFIYSFNNAGLLGQSGAWSLDAWRSAFSEPGMLAAIQNTFKVLIVTEAIAMPIAIIVAWLVARTDLPARGMLEFLFWISFFLPPLSVTQGWIILLAPNAGALNQLAVQLPFIDDGPFNIYSFWGIIWAHLATQAISVKVMLLIPSFRNLDASFEEAARTSGADRWQTLRMIVVPVGLPAILTVLVLSTIRVLQTFEIEMVLGPAFNFWVFGTMIFRIVETVPPQFGTAAALATTVFLLVAPLIILHRWLLTRKDYTSITGRGGVAPTRLGAWRMPVFILICIVVAMLTLLPVAFLVMASFMKLIGFFTIPDPWTLDHWQRVLNDSFFVRALQNTVKVAGSTAIVSIVFCSLIAYFAIRSRYAGRGVLDFLSWLPFTIPGILLGIGILFVVLSNPVTRVLYGTLPVLVLAITVAHMTLGTQIVKSTVLQLGKTLEEAGRTSGATWWYCMRKIVMPILAPTLVLVGIVNFIGATRDIASVALLAANDTKTLSLLQLDYLTDGRLEVGAVISVVMITLTTGVAFLARMLGLKVGVRG